MKTLRRVTVTLILTFLVCFALVSPAFAHPLGNFTINQYAGLHVSRESIRLDYVLDMAEIPAFQEISAFDMNQDRQPDPAEASAYPAEKCASLRPDLRLSLNNHPVDLSPGMSSVEFPVGVGGLPTLRLTCEFQVEIVSGQNNLSLTFENHVYADRPGWREIVVVAEGVSLDGDYITSSASNRLTGYPDDLLTSPLDQRQIEFEITAIALPGQNETSKSAAPLPPLADRNDAFTRLILLEEVTFPTLLLALVVSFVWGAMHAMTPGHGKTIVGAYLVGSRGTIKHALYLGLTTTITHTLGVFALGLITLFAAQYIVPETLYPWMSLLSGLFVVGIGLNLFTGRLRSSGLAGWLKTLSGKLIRKPIRAYSPVLAHAHAEGLVHRHKHVLNQVHDHHHGLHTHSHDDHDHGHHDHHTNHSHLPPGSDGAPVTWRGLLALGISGGLLPCPSALVVLLGAIALNKIGFGLILVLAFSLGLAGALTAIGMMFIYAGKLFQRFPFQGRLLTFIPAASALFISAIGFVICINALTEMGIL